MQVDNTRCNNLAKATCIKNVRCFFIKKLIARLKTYI